MKRYFVILIAVLAMTVVILPVARTPAETCNFNVSTGNWGDSGNWSCGHVPTPGDLAVIKTGNTCTMNVAAAVADSLTVESAATLNVQASKKLSLDSSTANTTLTGTVNLQGSDSELAFVDNDQTIDGAGKIVGQHNAATISMAFEKILTNDTTIKGKLQITGLGDFVNNGTVHANVSGVLLIDCNSIDDDSGAEWKISTSSSAVLQIAVASLLTGAMDGDWTIADDGTLDLDSKGFTTTGSLVWTGGTIDVAAGHNVLNFGG